MAANVPNMFPDGTVNSLRNASMKGTLYVGFGDTFDQAKLKALPPGSFWTEPANINHFLMTKDEPVSFQITGIGPSGTTFVDPAHDPRKK